MNKPKVGSFIQEICSAMGDAYHIVPFDLEMVIYRNFGNGYEIEISGLNCRKRNKKARIYLWKDRSRVAQSISIYPITPENLTNAIQKLFYKEGAVL